MLINTCFFHPSYLLPYSGLFYSHLGNISCPFVEVIDKNDGKTEINIHPWGILLKRIVCIGIHLLITTLWGWVLIRLCIDPFVLLHGLYFSVFHASVMKCPVKGQIPYVIEYVLLIYPAVSPIKNEMKFLCQFSQMSPCWLQVITASSYKGDKHPWRSQN